MKTYYLKNLSDKERRQLTRRPSINLEEAFKVVKPILDEIKKDGLKSAIKYAKKYDDFSGENLLVTKEDFQEAKKNLDYSTKAAIETAAENIQKFHNFQFPKPYSVETMKGVFCSREFRAIENVGLYVPGGNAVLPSTMLMLGIPAMIAGCKRIVVCSPAKNGKINYPFLYAAKVCGINEIYKIGGAQAIGLMAYGDTSIQKVNKIFGPGNQYVTAAKLLLSINPDGCAIDMPAGPSEVLIIADETSNPSFIAADLLSQAEHGNDSQVVLISTSKETVEKVLNEVNKQSADLARKNFVKKSLENSFALIVEDLQDAFSFSNDYAPEHLILHIKDAENYKGKVQNAGSVFLGEYSPESAGDYASGTNHSLPTSGYAKSFGGVTVETFMKSVTFQNLNKEGLKSISSTVMKLAEVEGLDAHKNAVKIRINELRD